jgi:hypothetical protein
MKAFAPYRIFSFSLCLALVAGFPFHKAGAAGGIQYLQYEDLKPYHFGFSVGLHTQDLIFDHSGIPDSKGYRWYGSVNRYDPGFSVGLIGDVRITDFLSLRSTPSIHFGSKEVTLVSTPAGNNPVTASVRSNYVLFPLNLRYRGHRTDNYRPYVMSGLSAGLNVGRDKQQPLLLRPVDLYWEFGTGMDLYMPQFRLVPELKVCIGLGDILVHHRNEQSGEVYQKYADALNSVTSRLIVFSIQFE